MDVRGDKNDAVFNYSFIKTSDRSIQKNTIHCIYNDCDQHDSYLGAWVLDQYFQKHVSKRYHAADYLTNSKRIPSGAVFLLGIVGNMKTMQRLIDNATVVFIVSNDDNNRDTIDKLQSRYESDKLQVLHDTSKSVCVLVNRLFNKKKRFPLIDAYVDIKGKPEKFKDFVKGFDAGCYGFVSLNQINENPERVDDVICRIGEDYDMLVDTYFDSYGHDKVVGELETCGERIPIIKITRPALRDGIAKRLLDHLGAPTAGVIYGADGNTRVHVRNVSEDLDLEYIANAFGGHGKRDVCSFTIEGVSTDEFF